MSERQRRLKKRQEQRNEDKYQTPSYARAVAKRRKIMNQSSRTRKDIEVLKELEEEIKQRRVSLPSTPPIVLKERASRQTSPTCLYFGQEEDFRKKYPDFFFCSECRAWENECKNPSSAKCKRSSRRFRCTGKHDSYIYPTSRTPIHSSLLAEFKLQEQREEHNREEQDMTDDDGRSISDLLETTEAETAGATQESYNKNRCGTNHELRDRPSQFTPNEIETLRMTVSNLKEENKNLERKLAAVKQTNYRLNLQQKMHATSIISHRSNLGNSSGSIPHSSTSTTTTILSGASSSNSTNKGRHSAQQEMSLQELRVLCLNIKHVISGKRHSKKKKKQMAELVYDLFVNNDFIEGLFKRECETRYRDYLRKEVFPPWKVLRAMDLAGGGLCLTGLEILRECETQGKKYYRNSIIPCAAEMKRTAALVERYADKVGLKFRHSRLEDGTEYVEVENLTTTVNFILKAYQLDEVAKTRSVSLSAAIDGAQLSKRQTHTTMGLKVNDRQAVCPITKRPLFAGSVSSGSSSSTSYQPDSLVQSRNCCFPLKIMLAPETKGLYKHFEHLFTAFNNEYEQTLTNGGVVSPLLGEDFKPMKCNINCDLCAQWKGLKRGGAMKQMKKACTCCAIDREDVAEPNLKRCDRWCKEYETKFPDETGPGWRCFHKDMLNDKKLQEMQEEIEDLENVMNDIASRMESIHKASEIKTDENPNKEPPSTSDSRKDISSIWFDIAAGEIRNYSEVVDHARKLTRDLARRGLLATGTVRQKQQRLKESLRHEYKLHDLQTSLSHGRLGSEDALFILMNTLPCILHLENRVGLKMFTKILEIGLDNVKNEKTYTTDQGYREMSMSNRIQCFLDDINHACNTEILGTPANPSQFNCPYDRDKKAIDTITLDNNRTRLIVSNPEPILNICIVDGDDELISSWVSCLEEYRKGLQILRSRHDLSEQEIFTFQRHIDVWFSEWIDLCGGSSAITNYIHMLASGHIADYLFHWRNLWIYSQQGWEALNAMIKTFFLRRTGRGGSSGPRGDKSRLKPIGRWFQRRMIWMTGYCLNDFLQELGEVPSNSGGRSSSNLVSIVGDDDVVVDNFFLI